MNGLPDEEAESLKDEFNVAIHCIGIGSDVNYNELKTMASEPAEEHAFRIKNFKTLSELTDRITRTATGM